MKNKELKDETLASSSSTTGTAGAADAEVANRRSFMKTLAAGTVAAGTLAGVTAKAATPTAAQNIYAQRLIAQPRKNTAVLRLSFSQRRPPKLQEVFRAIEAVLEPTGCTACGFDGLDFLLRLDDIITPSHEGFVATLEGELVGR